MASETDQLTIAKRPKKARDDSLLVTAVTIVALTLFATVVSAGLISRSKVIRVQPVRSTATGPGAAAGPVQPPEPGILMIHMDMNEFGYAPNSVSVPSGMRVRLTFRNVGKVEHEAMIGDLRSQELIAADKAHNPASSGAGTTRVFPAPNVFADTAGPGSSHSPTTPSQPKMVSDDGMRQTPSSAPSADDLHDRMPSILLGAGREGYVDVTFDKPGEQVIGCHVPGHWEAGMKATIKVS